MAENTNDWNMKWLTSFQDKLVETQHLTRIYKKSGRPTEEQFKEIKLTLHNASEALMYWSSPAEGWEKIHSEFPLKNTQEKLEELKELEAQGIRADEE